MFHARGGCPNCRRRGEVQRVRWKRWNKSLYSPMPQLTTRLILAKKTLGHHQMNCGSTGVCLHTPGSCQIGQSSRHWLTGCLGPLRDGAFAGFLNCFSTARGAECSVRAVAVCIRGHRIAVLPPGASLLDVAQMILCTRAISQS
jgi:hypothetical protein